MKQFIVFSLVLLLLLTAGCSNKYDSIVQGSPSPVLSFNKDSLRVREKDAGNVGYSGKGLLTIYCGEVGRELNLQIEDTSTGIHVLYRGTAINTGESLPVMDSIAVFVYADAPGLYALDFYLTDRLGKTAKKSLPVICSANQAPVANFFYEAIAASQSQSWPYRFNASLSSKTDGIITGYHFSINGQAIDTYQPILDYVFHARGEQLIGLYVTDDLGKTSARITQKIIIP